MNPQATLTEGVRGCSDDESFSLEGGEDDDNMLLDFLREENAAKCAPAIFPSMTSWQGLHCHDLDKDVQTASDRDDCLPALNNPQQSFTRAPARCPQEEGDNGRGGDGQRQGHRGAALAGGGVWADRGGEPAQATRETDAQPRLSYWGAVVAPSNARMTDTMT